MKRNLLVLSLATLVAILGLSAHAVAGESDALLLEASFKGDLAKVTELVNGGTDVNFSSKTTGVTPLIAASANGHLDVVSFLLEKGADAGAVSNRGLNALAVAGLTDKVDQIEGLLIKKGAGDQSLIDAAAKGDLDTVKALLDSGVNINAKEEVTGFTPLIAAAYHGDLDTVEFLLEKGADVNAKTSRGVTALIAASIDENNTEIAKLLLDKGADVNAKTKSGKTALQFSSFMEEFVSEIPERIAKGTSGASTDNTMSKLLKERGAK